MGDAEVDVTDTEVRLLDSTGSILAEILSDKDGDFEFDGLPAGEYFVEVIPPDWSSPGRSHRRHSRLR